MLIVDWADARKALVESDTFPRCMYPLRRLTLTKVHIKLRRGARSGAVKKAWKDNKIAEKWAACRPAQKLAVATKRANLDDLERFSVMINRKQRAFAVRKLASKQLNPKKGAVKKAVDNKKKQK